MEYYSARKHNEILPFATTWMETESIMLREISQSEKRQIPYDFTHIETEQISKGKNRGRQTKRQTLGHREQTDGHQRRGR